MQHLRLLNNVLSTELSGAAVAVVQIIFEGEDWDLTTIAREVEVAAEERDRYSLRWILDARNLRRLRAYLGFLVSTCRLLEYSGVLPKGSDPGVLVGSPSLSEWISLQDRWHKVDYYLWKEQGGGRSAEPLPGNHAADSDLIEPVGEWPALLEAPAIISTFEFYSLRSRKDLDTEGQSLKVSLSDWETRCAEGGSHLVMVRKGARRYAMMELRMMQSITEGIWFTVQYACGFRGNDPPLFLMPAINAFVGLLNTRAIPINGLAINRASSFMEQTLLYVNEWGPDYDADEGRFVEMLGVTPVDALEEFLTCLQVSSGRGTLVNLVKAKLVGAHEKSIPCSPL